MLGLAAHEPARTGEQRRWHRERRSAWLRLVVLAILIANLGVASRYENVLSNLVVGYGIITLAALALAECRRGAPWLGTVFVILDALMVVVLFHDHLFAPGKALDHALTAPSLAIGFVLLTHVALRLQPKLLVLFSSLVIVGWLSLLTVAAETHLGMGSSHAFDRTVFLRESALAAAFGFAAFVCWLLTNDHNVLLGSAVASERRRANLSRFFSPTVLGDLESTSTSLALSRRRVAVMFMDLRSFTRLSETVSPEEMAELLGEFRELVTREVFAHGGMIDKFIGDGIMAAFGQPRTSTSDAARALGCAIHLGESLARWKERRQRAGKIAPEAGIGLHAGVAIGGILQSGSHDEFTLFGDTVNVAERLERLCKTLEASMVVSEEAMSAAGHATALPWHWIDNVQLEGRAGRLRVAYLPRRTVRHLQEAAQ